MSFLRISFVTTQFLSGHGLFAEYLHRFGLRQSPQCICGHEVQDNLHIIFTCIAMQDLRHAANLSLSIEGHSVGEPWYELSRQALNVVVDLLNSIHKRLRFFESQRSM